MVNPKLEQILLLNQNLASNVGVMSPYTLPVVQDVQYMRLIDESHHFDPGPTLSHVLICLIIRWPRLNLCISSYWAGPSSGDFLGYWFSLDGLPSEGWWDSTSIKGRASRNVVALAVCITGDDVR